MLREVFLSLDLISLTDALQIAEKAVKAGFKQLEIGTPLIKSEGMRAVKEFRRKFPELTIFADTKTMDTGSLEAELVFKSGGDIMSVMAAAPNETILSAVKEADKWGKEVLADTLGVRDVESRVRELMKLGVHRICLHKGVDEGIFSDFELVDKLREFGIKVGVAGGINEDSLPKVREVADFVMVGRAITKAGDPEEAAKRILKAAGLLTQ